MHGTPPLTPPPTPYNNTSRVDPPTPPTGVSTPPPRVSTPPPGVLTPNTTSTRLSQDTLSNYPSNAALLPIHFNSTGSISPYPPRTLTEPAYLSQTTIFKIDNYQQKAPNAMKVAPLF